MSKNKTTSHNRPDAAKIAVKSPQGKEKIVNVTAEPNEVRSRPSRKRTRSEKGQLFDEMMGKSPSQDRSKVLKNGKSKAIRRIVFNDEKQVNVNGKLDSNNNASMRVLTKGSTRDKLTDKAVNRKDVEVKDNPGKLLDPCFRNVWRKEMQANKNKSVCNSTQQVNHEEEMDTRDGIILSVDAEEYIDNIDDEEVEDLQEVDMVEGDHTSHE